MVTVRAATHDLMRARGMTTVFGNPGSTELGFLHGFPADLRYVLALHEGVAVGMADGYAQALGRPALVNLHSACGVGNAMGAVVNAFHNRAPLVITTGNQDRRHLADEPYLFARSAELALPYVKHSEQPARAADVPRAIERAWQLAQSPPAGPVLVSVPLDDWDAEAEPVAPSTRHPGGRASDAAIAEIVARLEQSVRPALVAGAGIDRAGAWPATVALAERLGASVWAAPQAPRAGFPEDHPLFQGHLAPGRASAAAQLAEADLALVLGAPVFAYLPFEPGGALPALVHVTDDPDEAARGRTALSVVADVGDVAERVAERLRGRRAPWRGPRAAPAPPPPSAPIAPAFLMAALAAALPPDAVIVEESPSNRAAFRRHVPIRRPASFYATASGGLGFAMPAAVGIKLADPSRPVLCVVGDGSALYGPQTLWNAVQLGLAVVFVIVNNGRYAILDAAAQFAGLRDVPGLELPGIDFLALARGFGCHAMRVEDPAELAGALAGAFAADGSAVLDVTIDPVAPPLVATP